MQRPGIDPNNVQMSDILCDFCLTPWNDEGVFIEGHQGSVICGKCLSVAYTEVVLHGSDKVSTSREDGAGNPCTMCLETRDESGWTSPVNEKALICKRCIELAAQTLEKDRDTEWVIPG